MEALLNRAKYLSLKKKLVISNKLSICTLVLLLGSVHLTEYMLFWFFFVVFLSC